MEDSIIIYRIGLAIVVIASIGFVFFLYLFIRESRAVKEVEEKRNNLLKMEIQELARFRKEIIEIISDFQKKS